ncbi:MAG: ATP-binding cassette domain-containing protein [Polyangiaceae bacterium]|nr:ATP-binding cassette domain-containing protein [Polyangiaceae bacterium]
MDEGLSVRDLTFRYGDVHIADDESFDVPRGGTLVVTGGNGVGKSTLLYLCAGLVAPHSGVVTLNGHVPVVDRPSHLVRKGVRIGFLFQQGGLVSNLNVLANVKLGLRYHADLFNLTDKAIDERAKEALDRVRIADSELYAMPAHLSFGTRKRAALARAIALQPNFVFLDDPDAGLDTMTAKIVGDILFGLRDDPEVTSVVCTNHRALIEAIGCSTKELCAGSLLAQTYRRVE